jgi:uncharacterized protein (TIRG00374 family)
MKKGSGRRILAPVVKLAATLGLLAFFVTRFDVDLASMQSRWAASDLRWWWGGMGVMSLMILTGLARWHLILRAVGAPLPFRETSLIGMIGHFFTSFSVGVVGGDVARLFYGVRAGHHSKTKVFLSILSDRIVGLLGLCVVACVALPLNWSMLMRTPATQALAWSVSVALIGFVSGLAVLLVWEYPGPWQRWLAWKEHLPFRALRDKISAALHEGVRHKSSYAAALAVSVLVHLSMIGCACAVALSLHLPVSLLWLAGIMPIVATAQSLPITLSGFGVREGVLVLFFQTVGLGAAEAFVFSFALQAISLAWGAIGGIVYVLYRTPGEHLATAAEESDE